MLIVLVIAVPVAYSALTSSTSYVLGFNGNGFSSPGINHITMIGVDQAIQGPPEDYAFVQSLASQGLRWDRDSVGNHTQAKDLNWANDAGIKVLGLIGGSDPETSCVQGGPGSGVLRQESQYKSYIQLVINDWPWIHNWEYGNEPQSYWCNISPAHYFQGLVWTYEVLSTTPGHQNDTIQGPTETIYTDGWSGVWDGYDGCGTSSCVDGWSGSTFDKIGWFYTFWHQSIADSFGTWTPERILSYVSLHVYTQNELFSDVPAQGPYHTFGAMLSAALSVYYSVTGNSKSFVISETGIIANSSGGLAKQAKWYQQMMPFYRNQSFVAGVFAYSLYNPEWGLFTVNLQPRPAWSVYQSYFQDASTTTSSISSSSLTNSSSATSSASINTSSTSRPETSSTLSSISSTTYSSSTQTVSSRPSSQSTSVKISHSGGNSTQESVSSNPGVGFLSSLSPSKNPPAAAGFATYEISLVAGFTFLLLNFLRVSDRRMLIR